MRQDSLPAHAETHSVFSQGQPFPRCQDTWARGCAGDPGGPGLVHMFWALGGHRSLVGPAPAWAQRREAAHSRGRSGWVRSTYVRAGHVSSCWLRSPALWPGPSTPQHRGHGDLESSLMRIGAGAGQKETQCDTHSAFSGHRSRRQHSLFIRLDSEVTLRIYFYVSKSCLICVEGHKAFSLFPSVLHPQEVHARIRVSGAKASSNGAHSKSEAAA